MENYVEITVLRRRKYTCYEPEQVRSTVLARHLLCIQVPSYWAAGSW